MRDRLTREVYVIAFIIGALVVFNLFPLISSFIKYTTYNVLEFLSLVLINPLYIVICGIIYTLKYELSWFLVIILPFCFIPTIALFFSLPYMFYILIYVIFIISSEIFGTALKRKREIK